MGPLLSVLIVASAVAATQPLPDRPQIETQHESERAAEREPVAGKREAEAEKPTPVREAAVTVVQAAPSAPKGEQTHEEGNEFWPPFMSYRVKVTDSLLVLCTFLLWIATRALVNDAKATGEKELRAYIGVKPHPDYPPPTLEEMHTEGLRFHVVNYGKTPAHRVTQEISMGQWPEDNPVLTEPVRPANGRKFLLHAGANSDMVVTKRTPLNEAEKVSIRKGELKVFVWGKIWYEDAFAKKRWTSFRWHYDGSALQWTEEGNEGT